MSVRRPAVSVVVLSRLCAWRRGCVWQEERFRRDLGFERRRSPDDGGPLGVRPLAVAVLPCEAGAGHRRLLAVGRGGATTVVAAVVSVHPGEEVSVLRPSLIKAVMAGHGATPAAHLDKGVTLRVVARHGDAAASSRSFRNHLLLERSGGGGGGG